MPSTSLMYLSRKLSVNEWTVFWHYHVALTILKSSNHGMLKADDYSKESICQYNGVIHLSVIIPLPAVSCVENSLLDCSIKLLKK